MGIKLDQEIIVNMLIDEREWLESQGYKEFSLGLVHAKSLIRRMCGDVIVEEKEEMK